MSKARNIARLVVDSSGDLDASNLGNAPNPIVAGTIAYIGKNTAPDGWLKANGAAVSRTTYAALFAAIGTTYGVGDGSTTFNLPDLRGEFVRGWDDGRGADTSRAFGSAQTEATKDHSHTMAFEDLDTRSVYSYTPTNATSFGSGDIAIPLTKWLYSGTYNNGSTPGMHGGTGGAETRPRNVALLACIKT